MKIFHGEHILVSTFGISTVQTIDFCVIVFACLNAAIIPAVYVFFPGKLTILLTTGHAYLPFTETAGRSLEGKFMYTYDKVSS